MIKRVSGFGLITNPTIAPIGIKIEIMVAVTPSFVLKRDARKINIPTIGIIMNKKSISSLP